MMDEIDSNLLAATSATDFMTSTPAVHRSIPPKKKPVRSNPVTYLFYPIFSPLTAFILETSEQIKATNFFKLICLFRKCSILVTIMKINLIFTSKRNNL